MESDQSFRLMADSAPVMIWRSDADNLCIYVNRLWLEFRGRTISQELGTGWLEGVHPDDLARCEQVFAKSLIAKKPFSMEYRLQRFDGEYRTILDNGVPLFDSSEDFAGYIGSGFDITPRKEVETELVASKELLHRQNLYLTALHDTALGIVNQLDQATLLETLVAQIADPFDGHRPRLWSALATDDYPIDGPKRKVVEPGADSVTEFHLTGVRPRRAVGNHGRTAWSHACTGRPVIRAFLAATTGKGLERPAPNAQLDALARLDRLADSRAERMSAEEAARLSRRVAGRRRGR